jgi:hypothetical protein
MRNILEWLSGVQNYITTGLAAIVVVTSLGWYITDLRLDTANEKVKTCKEGRELDRSRYEAAQHEYEAKALSEKQAIEQRNRERAEEADANYGSLLAQYNAALVRRYASAGSESGRANLPGTVSSPSGSDGPSSSPVVPEVTITYEDAEICAENTARLKIAQEWAEGRE